MSLRPDANAATATCAYCHEAPPGVGGILCLPCKAGIEERAGGVSPEPAQGPQHRPPQFPVPPPPPPKPGMCAAGCGARPPAGAEYCQACRLIAKMRGAA